MTDKIKIKDIKRNPGQPRSSIREEDLNTMMESVRRYGILTPVIIDKNHMVIDGQTRLLAAGRVGITELEFGKEVVIRDLDADVYSQVAHTRTEPRDLDKAKWLKARIEERVGAPRGAEMNALQVINHIDKHRRRGDQLRISEDDVKEIDFICWAIMPGEEISIRHSRRLLEMLDWPQDVQDVVQRGDMSPRTAEEVARIKEPKARKQVIETAKEKDWGRKKVEKASQAVRAVDTPKEKEQVVEAMKGGIEPESVKRVTQIKKPEVRSRALDDLVEVVKDKKKGETYVVEVAEEEDEGKAPPVTIHLRDPETRYLTKMNDLHLKIVEEVKGSRIARMENEDIKADAIMRLETMIRRLEEELAIAKGQEMMVIDA